MNRHITFILLLVVLILPNILNAQGIEVRGKIVENRNQTPLSGVYVILINSNDTTLKKGDITDVSGNFIISGLKPGTPYIMRVSFIGYNFLERKFQFTKHVEEIGTLMLEEKLQTIDEVVIQGQAPPAIQKGDTTEMNASAFKVNPDATAHDLVQKMPGVTVESGTVKAQGEEIKRIMIDGKNYFGEDPSMALQNLPAEVIDKVQIFNKMSDQAEFTGFDDGQSSKVMNIITRADRRNGTNGLFTAASDFYDKYAVSARLNLSEGQRRITLTGGSNNVNMQNFNMQDMLGAFGSGGDSRSTGRGGGGRMRSSSGNTMFIGRQGGINTTHSAGVNYSNTLSKKVSLNGSYFFNMQDNVTEQFKNSLTFLKDDSLYSNQASMSESRNINHRFDMRLEYTIDSANSFVWSPRFSTQQNNRGSHSERLNYYSVEMPELLDSSVNNSDGLGYNYSSDLVFRHKFEKKGRTVSLGATISGNLQDSDGTQWSLAVGSGNNRNTSDLMDTTLTDQKSDSKTKGQTISSNLAYTEPIGQISIIQLSYNASFTDNQTERYSYDRLTDALDVNLSNVYKNKYNTHRGGITYRIRGGDKVQVSLGADYQMAYLIGDRTYPQESHVNKSFENILPNAMLNFKPSQKANLRMMYRTSTNPPSVNQLQDVVTVITRSYSYSEGNPDLKHEYTHTGSANFRFSDPAKSTNFGFNLFGNYILNNIGTSYYIKNDDSIYIVFPGDTLKKTGQITKPVNFKESWNTRLFMNYGVLVKPLKCNFNLIGGGGYSKTPGYVNRMLSTTNQYNLTGGLVIASNISQNIDFTTSYTANYTIAQIVYNDSLAESLNSQTTNQNSNTWYHSISVRSNFIWKGFVLQNSLVEQINRGLAGGYNQDFLQWNISLGKKFLKNNSGELKFTVFDVLNQNQNITHSVSASEISDSRTNTLQRYFLLSFSYNLRNYKAPTRDHDHAPGFGRGMRSFEP